MGDGMRCRGSRTWHVEDGIALVHGKHVGASANIHAGVLGLDVPNGQDAVEVHGPVGKLPVTHPCPHEGVGWRLRKGSADKNIHKSYIRRYPTWGKTALFFPQTNFLMD